MVQPSKYLEQYPCVSFQKYFWLVLYTLMGAHYVYCFAFALQIVFLLPVKQIQRVFIEPSCHMIYTCFAFGNRRMIETELFTMKHAVLA